MSRSAPDSVGNVDAITIDPVLGRIRVRTRGSGETVVLDGVAHLAALENPPHRQLAVDVFLAS